MSNQWYVRECNHSATCIVITLPMAQSDHHKVITAYGGCNVSSIVKIS
jgi:hypothetical protein